MPVTLKGNVRIEGIDELNTLFKNLVPAMQKSFSDITNQYANTILQEMRSIVPVKTGYLKSTIGSSNAANALQLFVTASYAGYINYGTRRMRARPFFTGPVERQAPNMIKALNQAFADYIASNVKR
jgi:HK97 gp10 family phage protein